MFFFVNIFISTEDGIGKKLLFLQIKFVIILNLLIILIWRTYQHNNREVDDNKEEDMSGESNISKKFNAIRGYKE